MMYGLSVLSCSCLLKILPASHFDPRLQTKVGYIGGFSTNYEGLILFIELTAAFAGYNGAWRVSF
jgi:hypothetical protein